MVSNMINLNSTANTEIFSNKSDANMIDMTDTKDRNSSNVDMNAYTNQNRITNEATASNMSKNSDISRNLRNNIEEIVSKIQWVYVKVIVLIMVQETEVYGSGLWITLAIQIIILIAIRIGCFSFG